jgi:cytoskeletal protein CcmA (bactofilin family)
MAKQNRTVLKTYFESGDIPNQSQYSDLIDSNLNLSETTDQTTAGGLNITGNITASGNISASGTIFADNFQSTGGDVAGISFTDDLNLTGNITASGNISASGDITVAGNVRVGTRIVFTNGLSGNSILAGNPNELNFAGSDVVRFAPHVKLDSHLTASGNISASGIINAQQLNLSNQLYADFNGTVFRVGASAPTIHINDFDVNDGNSGNSVFLDASSGNITASGNISASGTGQFGNSLTVTGPDAILNLYEGGTLQTSLHSRGNIDSFIEAGVGNIANVGIGTTTPPEKLTVEGNISSSGTITGQNIILGSGGQINAKDTSGNNELVLFNNTDTFLGFGDTDQELRIQGSSVRIISSFTSSQDALFTNDVTFEQNITASGDIIASDLILTSPNGSKFKFTVNNSGHLSLTGSAV